LIKPENLAETHRFFEKHGGKTIILARFLPFVRTFAPFVAGMSKMNHSLFLRYNVIGAVIWVASLCYLGYVLGQNEWVKLHLEKIIILMIVIPGLPAVWKVLKSYLAKKQAAKKNNSPSI
jgi:membrane-associated protein